METRTDPSQHRRFGFYQLRKGAELFEAGIFFDREVLSEKEQMTARAYARMHGLKCRTIAEFVDEVFFRMAYELRANIVGFNLPFDLSRLAIRHGSARGKMRGGFTFALSDNPWQPNVVVRHLSARSAFIQFAGKRRRLDNKRSRKQGSNPTVDLLDRLAQTLNVLVGDFFVIPGEGEKPPQPLRSGRKPAKG